MEVPDHTPSSGSYAPLTGRSSLWATTPSYRASPPFSSSRGVREYMKHSFENTGRRGPGQFKAEPLDGVIPAWSAGIQADMDVPGRIRANLDAGYPCRHDEDLYFHVLRASVS